MPRQNASDSFQRSRDIRLSTTPSEGVDSRNVLQKCRRPHCHGRMPLTPSEGVRISRLSSTPSEGVDSRNVLQECCRPHCHGRMPLTPSKGVEISHLSTTPSEGVEGGRRGYPIQRVPGDSSAGKAVPQRHRITGFADVVRRSGRRMERQYRPEST